MLGIFKLGYVAPDVSGVDAKVKDSDLMETSYWMTDMNAEWSF